MEAIELPIIRKLIAFGNSSKGITLPKSWLELIEKETGKTVKEVAVEVDEFLTIQPIIPEKTEK